MSFCRFSTDDFQCDVYVYADVVGGFTTHVAKTRPFLDRELPAKVPLENINEYMERHKKVKEWLDTAERRPIGLSRDGMTFSDKTAAEAAGRLQSLKEEGYNVPQYVIDALREYDENEDQTDMA
jgi:hypothetical protein